MSLYEAIGAAVSGGVLGVVSVEVRKAYVSKRARDLDERKLDTGERRRDQDTTARHLRREEDRHVGCLERVDKLQGELLDVSKAQARCEEREHSRAHEVTELRKDGAEMRKILRRVLSAVGMSDEFNISDDDEGSPAE